MTQKDYINKNQERFLNELLDWLRIPSISADPAFSDDVHKAAAYVADKLASVGAENVSIEQTAGYPIVYADKIIDPSKPTVLVYGHYDVQPSVPDELWDTP
ncbi:MAG: acetylornithine deacetylase/succinyl-diaminopimelate desuccinylase-like protein, partial [Bacteroidia bacterium]